MKKLTCTFICAIFILSGCGTTPKKPKTKTTPKKTAATQSAKTIKITHVNAQKGGQEVMMYAMSLIGIGYKFGGSNPQAGFDCSGMVNYIYQNALGVKLPRTARDIAASSTPISKSNLKVGDLVFFNTSGNDYSHMGIYIGENRFVHAPSTNGFIRTESLDSKYFSTRFTSARTLFSR